MQNFNELNLSAPILKAISELGFEIPSPIQAQTLPILLGEPTDFLGLAATGTGKTAAFAIPLLERIDPNRAGVQALILCPTRELAMQLVGQIELIGKYKKIRAVAVYGGAGYGDQFKALKRGVSVVVGTPGRLIDHLERGTLVLDNLETIVLDEADEMISMGFKEDIETILETVPPGVANTWLFSATMGRDVRKVADEFLREPQQVQINRTEMLSENVEQIYYATQESNKTEVLCKLIDMAADDFYGLVFFQTKALVVELTQYLIGRGYKADCLHGDMDQNARERTMKAFRERKAQILLCTDVASRGLDVKDITHVINYSIPRELDNYVHRIGRTARSGKSGVAMSLVTPSHRGLIGRIEKMTKSRMKEGKIPTRKEIGIKKVSKILCNFQAQDTYARANELMGDEWKQAISTMTPDEIAGRFLTLMYPETFTERAQADTARGAVRVGVGPVGIIKSEERMPQEDRAPRGDRRKQFSDRDGGGERREFRGFQRGGPGAGATDRPRPQSDWGKKRQRPEGEERSSFAAPKFERREGKERSSFAPAPKFERREGKERAPFAGKGPATGGFGFPRKDRGAAPWAKGGKSQGSGQS